MDVLGPEEQDGIRLTWNIWPNSRLEATKCVIPFAALYTPTKKLASMPVRRWGCGHVGLLVGQAWWQISSKCCAVHPVALPPAICSAIAVECQ